MVEKGGWQPVRIRYFNPLGVLAWALSGRLFGRDRITAWQTDFVERIIPVLQGADRLLRGKWLGQSLIAVGER